MEDELSAAVAAGQLSESEKAKRLAAKAEEQAAEKAALGARLKAEEEEQVAALSARINRDKAEALTEAHRGLLDEVRLFPS